jgi:hypothetical protein
VRAERGGCEAGRGVRRGGRGGAQIQFILYDASAGGEADSKDLLTLRLVDTSGRCGAGGGAWGGRGGARPGAAARTWRVQRGCACGTGRGTRRTGA